MVSVSNGIFAGEGPGTAVVRATFHDSLAVNASASVDLTVHSSPINVTLLELTLSGGGVLYWRAWYTVCELTQSGPGRRHRV